MSCKLNTLFVTLLVCFGWVEAVYVQHSLFHKKLSVVCNVPRFAAMRRLEAPTAPDDTPPYTTPHGTYIPSTTHVELISKDSSVYKFLLHFVVVQTPTWKLA